MLFSFSFSSLTDEALESMSLAAPGGTRFISCLPRLLFSAAQSDNDGQDGLPGTALQIASALLMSINATWSDEVVVFMTC